MEPSDLIKMTQGVRNGVRKNILTLGFPNQLKHRRQCWAIPDLTPDHLLGHTKKSTLGLEFFFLTHSLLKKDFFFSEKKIRERLEKWAFPGESEDMGYEGRLQFFSSILKWYCSAVNIYTAVNLINLGY